MPVQCGPESVRSGARLVPCPGWTRNVLSCTPTLLALCC